MKNTFLPGLITVFLLSSFALRSQEAYVPQKDSVNTWTFGMDFSAGILFFDRPATSGRYLPIETWGDFEKPFYTSYSQYQLSAVADYRLSKLLVLSASGGLASFLADPSHSGKSQNGKFHKDFRMTDYYLRPGIKIDLLGGNARSALFIKYNLNLALRTHTEEDASMNVSGDYTDRLQTTRKGFLVNSLFGLEWERFFKSSQFGYSLSLQYAPLHKFRPSAYHLDSYIISGEEQESSGAKYSYEKYQDQWVKDGSIKGENFYQQSFFLTVGLRYRL